MPAQRPQPALPDPDGICRSGAVTAPARRGRGAISNRSSRYEAEARFAADDGWPTDELPAPARTILGLDTSRSILSRNQSPDVDFDQSVNPYRGCEHGCAYCFARPSHAWLGLSPGLDFETRLFHKPKAPELLRAAFCKPSYRPEVTALGVNTDAYQPIERDLKLTRSILEVFLEFRHPVAIVTKSALILRDLDLLQELARQKLVKVCISVTSLDHRLSRKMEPRAASPQRRLDALERLNRAGVPTAVLVAPLIPALNDFEIEEILAAAQDAGTREASYILLRLPLEIKDLFAEWLRENVPHRAERVLQLMRSTHQGRLYDHAFGKRQTGSGPYADLLAHRFRLACRRLGIGDRSFELDTSRFRHPDQPGDQLTLF